MFASIYPLDTDSLFYSPCEAYFGQGIQYVAQQFNALWKSQIGEHNIIQESPR